MNLNILKNSHHQKGDIVSLPPLEDPLSLPTCIEDFKEWHYKTLRRLHKHAEKEPFSGYISLEVDIPKFIRLARELDLIDQAEYQDTLHYLKNDALKGILKQHALKTSGNKQQLIDRILSNISELDVRSSERYSDFYILTEKGRALVDSSYMRFQTEHTNFFKQCIDLMMKNNFNDAYRMICKQNAEKPIPPGIGCDWTRCYYDGLVEFEQIYRHQIENSENKLVTAAAIYANMSGDSLHDVNRYLKDAYCVENVIFDSLLYAHSLLSSELHFCNYNKYGILNYRFLATLDEVTCPICGNLDGQVFSLKEKQIGITCPPMHRGCRCITVSADNPKNNTARFARDLNGHGIKVPASMNWKMWKEKYLNK